MHPDLVIYGHTCTRWKWDTHTCTANPLSVSLQYFIASFVPLSELTLHIKWHTIYRAGLLLFPTFQPSVPRVHELHLWVWLCSKLKPTETLCFNPMFRQAYLRENTAKSSGIGTMGPYTKCFEIRLDVLSRLQVEQGNNVYPQLLLQRRAKRQKMYIMRISLTQISLLLC